MLPGDALTLYTDGLTEAHAPRRVLSVAQMIEQLRSSPRESAQDAIDALLGLIDPDAGSATTSRSSPPRSTRARAPARPRHADVRARRALRLPFRA